MPRTSRIARIAGGTLAGGLIVTGLTIGTTKATEPAFLPPGGCAGSDADGPISCQVGDAFDAGRDCRIAVQTTIGALRRAGATGTPSGGCTRTAAGYGGTVHVSPT